VVAIGKPFGDTSAVILAEDGSLINDSGKGELCISGVQVTNGYLNLPEKNKTSFFELKYQNENRQFYRTGDLVFRDQDGDYLYCGRIDHQVQVQGYRVELGELENQTKLITGNIQVAAIAKEKTPGNMQLFLFLENCPIETDLILNHLRTTLPFYMQPSKIINLDTFPLTISGKINRNQLNELIK
jgi:acyl-coenzyme A synthetase/AMP-(fatty) acid ligase